MSSQIEKLRDHLFATLDALQDKNDPMDVERAKAVAEVSKQMIDTAKVENDFLRITGSEGGTGFIPAEPQATHNSLPHPVERHWRKQ